MKKYIKDESTVLVINGTPYSLVKEEEDTVNNPCLICDLREDCCEGDGYGNFMEICTFPNGGEDLFFKVDWDIANKRILDYLDFNPE